MKRILLAVAILVALALPQPSMAEGCVPGDSAHNDTIISRLDAVFIVLMTAGKEISERVANEPPNEKTYQQLKQNTALLEGLLELYKQCDKIMTAGEPT